MSPLQVIVSGMRVRIRVDEQRLTDMLKGLDPGTMGGSYASTTAALLGMLGDLAALSFAPYFPGEVCTSDFMLVGACQEARTANGDSWDIPAKPDIDAQESREHVFYCCSLQRLSPAQALACNICLLMPECIKSAHQATENRQPEQHLLHQTTFCLPVQPGFNARIQHCLPSLLPTVLQRMGSQGTTCSIWSPAT